MYIPSNDFRSGRRTNKLSSIVYRLRRNGPDLPPYILPAPVIGCRPNYMSQGSHASFVLQVSAHSIIFLASLSLFTNRFRQVTSRAGNTNLFRFRTSGRPAFSLDHIDAGMCRLAIRDLMQSAVGSTSWTTSPPATASKPGQSRLFCIPKAAYGPGFKTRITISICCRYTNPPKSIATSVDQPSLSELQLPPCCCEYLLSMAPRYFTLQMYNVYIQKSGPS